MSWINLEVPFIAICPLNQQIHQAEDFKAEVLDKCCRSVTFLIANRENILDSNKCRPFESNSSVLLKTQKVELEKTLK